MSDAMRTALAALLAEVREGLEDEFADRTYLLESVERQLAELVDDDGQVDAR